MRNQVPKWMFVAFALLSSAVPAVMAAPAAPEAAIPAETAAELLTRRIVAAGDNGNLPFAVVDKQRAIVTIHDAQGHLIGSSSVLLGQMTGDQSTADVGLRTQTGQLRLQDRTTPAGRYQSQPGRNLSGEGVVWVDYAKAFAIHRLRPAPAVQQRSLRMESTDPRDKRISAGCVVVPETFYDQVVWPWLGKGRGVVYVMPEQSPWQQMWQNLAQQTAL